MRNEQSSPAVPETGVDSGVASARLRPEPSSVESMAPLVAELRALADCDSRAGEPLGKCMRKAADKIERLSEHADYIEAQWLAKAGALSAKDRELAEAHGQIETLTGDNAHLAGKLVVMMRAIGLDKDDDLLRDAVERIQVLATAERERDEAMAALREKEERVKALEADKARLDFLDACNAALNGRYGTNYGWTLVLTHNVTRLMLGRWMEVDLHDSEGGKAKLPSCRGAIDREMTRIDVERRARSLSSVQPVSGSREQRGNEEG